MPPWGKSGGSVKYDLNRMAGRRCSSSLRSNENRTRIRRSGISTSALGDEEATMSVCQTTESNKLKAVWLGLILLVKHSLQRSAHRLVIRTTMAGHPEHRRRNHHHKRFHEKPHSIGSTISPCNAASAIKLRSQLPPAKGTRSLTPEYHQHFFLVAGAAQRKAAQLNALQYRPQTLAVREAATEAVGLQKFSPVLTPTVFEERKSKISAGAAIGTTPSKRGIGASLAYTSIRACTRNYALVQRRIGIPATPGCVLRRTGLKSSAPRWSTETVTTM